MESLFWYVNTDFLLESMKRIQFILLAFACTIAISAKEYHVAKTGNDNNNGTQESPFLTIQMAANLAQPGDVITVHRGVYRERVNPPRGGTSNSKGIVYRAAKGEKVEIKGSEIVRNWMPFSGSVHFCIFYTFDARINKEKKWKQTKAGALKKLM